ncbi:WXG100 family type VII secretion target [Gordonia sp. 'Campus']|uniref:WXG100 family type VII secretion target n=1 Tax=Gordonia sp. 'Campus' TaxID=2915824 RepID=UPI001EE46297|nr:WXG100 family type VII secretion target [Gordonia sp. 'Campus']
MSDIINYNYAALGDLSGALRNSLNQLEDLNDLLKAQVAALDSWTSHDAKAAYLDTQSAFDRIFAQSRDSLNSIEHGVTNASRIMQDTDSAIGSGFRGLV